MPRKHGFTYKGFKKMDDVQNEPLIEESVEAADETGEVETQADDNVETEAQPEEDKVTFDERQQAVLEKAISGKVAQTYKERQRADEAEKKYSALLAAQPKPEEPQIPELPDPDEFYGDPDGYRNKIMEREAAVREHAEFNAQNKLIKDQQEQQANKAAYEQQMKQQELLDNYSKSANGFGIESAQMQQDAQTVVQAGIPQEVSDYLLSDAQGPLLTNYLAKNLLELDAVRNMSPINAAVYIATEVRPKLKGVKQSTKAPAPANIVGGGGVPDKTPASIKGATFV